MGGYIRPCCRLPIARAWVYKRNSSKMLLKATQACFPYDGHALPAVEHHRQHTYPPHCTALGHIGCGLIIL